MPLFGLNQKEAMVAGTESDTTQTSSHHVLQKNPPHTTARTPSLPTKKMSLFGTKRRMATAPELDPALAPSSPGVTTSAALPRRSIDSASSTASASPETVKGRAMGPVTDVRGSANGQARITIEEARNKWMQAQDAERAADEALENARRRVREAKELVARLETQTNEEVDRAQAKLQEIAEINRAVQALGRHG